jgi:hypothetical protein
VTVLIRATEILRSAKVQEKVMVHVFLNLSIMGCLFIRSTQCKIFLSGNRKNLIGMISALSASFNEDSAEISQGLAKNGLFLNFRKSQAILKSNFAV